MRSARQVAVAAALVVGGGGLVALGSTGCASDPLDAGQRSVVETLDTARPVGADAAAYVDANLDVLLSAEVAGAADGAALAAVFEDALAVETGRDDRMDAMAAAVATDGRIHSPELPVVFAEAIAADVGWVEARVNTALDLLPEVPHAPLSAYFAAHDLVREVVGDPDARAVVRAALDDYLAAAIAAAPDPGLERYVRIMQLSRLRTFAHLAERNADRGQARRDRDLDALEDEVGAASDRAIEGHRQFMGWLAAGRYATDQALWDAARGSPFVDDEGALRDPMSESQREAFLDWATRLVGPGDPLDDDFLALAAGADQHIRTLSVTVDGRYRVD
jgi:hypothetical protein